jgi:hypothetical protein
MWESTKIISASLLEQATAFIASGCFLTISLIWLDHYRDINKVRCTFMPGLAMNLSRPPSRQKPAWIHRQGRLWRISLCQRRG